MLLNESKYRDVNKREIYYKETCSRTDYVCEN